MYVFSVVKGCTEFDKWFSSQIRELEMSFLSVIITHLRILRIARYYLFVTGILAVIVLSKRGLDFVYFNKGRNPYGVLFTVLDVPSYLKYSFHRVLSKVGFYPNLNG